MVYLAIVVGVHASPQPTQNTFTASEASVPEHYPLNLMAVSQAWVQALAGV